MREEVKKGGDEGKCANKRGRSLENSEARARGRGERKRVK